MLRWIIAECLRLRLAVVILSAFLMGFGIWTALYRTPLDVFPEFSPPFLVIQTEAPGLSTEEVESLITLPLENALGGTTWLERMRTLSQPGISAIELFFHHGVDLFKVRHLVSERLLAEASRLPRGAGPPRIQPVMSSTSRLLMIGLTSKTLSPMDLRTLATWTIRPRLLAVQGVAAITIFGGLEKEYQVLVTPEGLHRSQVTLDDVRRAAREAVAVGGAGAIDTPAQRLPVQGKCPVESIEDLASVPVVYREGRAVPLGEVATVKVGAPLQVGQAVIGDPEGGVRTGVLLIAEKQPWFNTLLVTRELEEALEELRPAFPEGIEINTRIFRQATFIEHALSNLWKAMLIGCILVAVILFAFLAEWRTAAISLLAIPLSLLAAAVVLRQFDVEFNTMVLGGLAIAIGVVVDDAIIDVENILRRLKLNRESSTPRPAAAVVLDASLEVRSAVVYASLAVALVSLPVFFLSGIEGSFFRPLALSYITAVLASLVVALTVTPALGLLLLDRAARGGRTSALVRLLRSAYRKFLPWALRKSWLFLAAALLLLGGFLALAPLLWWRGDFLPSFRETNFVIHWISRPGTSISEMERIGLEVGRQIVGVPGVTGFGQHIGRAEGSEDIGDTNFAETWIGLAAGTSDYTGALEAVDEIASSFPGISSYPLTFLRERIVEILGEGASAPLVVRIFGPSLEVLRSLGEEVEEKLSKIPGVTRIALEPQREVPQLRIRFRRPGLSRYGLTPGELQDSVNTLLAGDRVAQVYEGQKVFDLAVWGAPEVRESLSSLGRILIDTPSGARAPLSALADLAIIPAPNRIVRENGSRKLDVTCAARGRGFGAVAEEISRRIEEIQTPPGHHLELRGEYRALSAGRREILALSLIALAGITFLLYLDFRSARETFLILLSLPFALVGGAFAVAAAGLGFGLGALVGFVTVFGIALRNGIMLVSHYRHLQLEEGFAFGEDLAVRGAEERLSPILMTSLATGLALIPFALGGDRPGFEIEHPMAVVIIGGLFSSTALNLILIPILYRILARPTAKGVEKGEGPDDASAGRSRPEW